MLNNFNLCIKEAKMSLSQTHEATYHRDYRLKKRIRNNKLIFSDYTHETKMEIFYYMIVNNYEKAMEKYSITKYMMSKISVYSKKYLRENPN
jgi:hypothetical protein